VRGAAAWAAGRLRLAGLAPRIELLADLEDPLVLLLDGEVAERSLGALARAALGSF
jgi:hypothetical protein